jgi:hypothetical protein
MVKFRKNKHGEIHFPDFPDFKPNLTPREIFKLGSFGGTYWRPIYSSVTNKNHRNKHLKYPSSWWTGINDDMMTLDWSNYDKYINKYCVKVGSTLEDWEEKDWIAKSHPYGWIQWYCDFYLGKRSRDDERQISRWIKTAGPNSRFRRRLINMIEREGTTYNDYSISPKIRQTLQHWAYVIKEHDVYV